jgi:hypothetical protein
VVAHTETRRKKIRKLWEIATNVKTVGVATSLFDPKPALGANRKLVSGVCGGFVVGRKYAACTLGVGVHS